MKKAKLVFLSILIFPSHFILTYHHTFIYRRIKNPFVLPFRVSSVEGHILSAKDVFDSFANMSIPSVYPPQVQLDLTNKCNEGCPYCSFPKKLQAELPLDKVKAFLEYFASHGGKSVFLTGGGEPGEYTYLEDFLEYFSTLPLILTLNTNGSFIRRITKIAEHSPEILQRIWSNDKEQATISVSVHRPEIFEDVKALDRLRKRLNLNLRIRTTYLISAETTPEDIQNFILRSQAAGADVASPKVMHIKGDREGERIHSTNQRVYEYLTNLDTSQFDITVESMRLNRLQEGFLATKRVDYDEIVCLGSFTRMVVNALGENSICCTAKIPGIGMGEVYFPSGKGLSLSVFDYYINTLWGMASFDNFYCIYGCGYLELNDYYDRANPEFITALKELRRRYQQGEITTRAEAVVYILRNFDVSKISKQEIFTKLFQEMNDFANQFSSPEEIESKLIPLIKQIPDDALNIKEKMNLLSLLLSKIPVSPISKADLNFMYPDYAEDIALALRDYVQVHPEKKSLRFAMMGSGNGLALFYIRMLNALLIDIPIDYYAYEIDESMIERCKSINPEVEFIRADFLDPRTLSPEYKDFDFVDITNVIHEIYSYGGYSKQQGTIDRNIGLDKIKSFLTAVNDLLSDGGIIQISDGFMPKDGDRQVIVRFKTPEAIEAFTKFKNEFVIDIDAKWLDEKTISISKYQLSLFMNKLPLLTIRQWFDMNTEFKEVYHYLSLPDYQRILYEANFITDRIFVYQQKTVLEKCFDRQIEIVNGEELPLQRMKIFAHKGKGTEEFRIIDPELIPPVISISDLETSYLSD